MVRILIVGEGRAAWPISSAATGELLARGKQPSLGLVRVHARAGSGPAVLGHPPRRGSEEMKARIRFATGQAAAGSVFREELRYWLADGRERIVDFAMHPIRDQSGAVIFLHPMGIDIYGT